METYEFAITVDNSGLSAHRVIVREREPYRFEAADCEDFVSDNVGEAVTKFWNAPRYNFFNVSLKSKAGKWSAQNIADQYTNKGILTFTGPTLYSPPAIRRGEAVRLKGSVNLPSLFRLLCLWACCGGHVPFYT